MMASPRSALRGVPSCAALFMVASLAEAQEPPPPSPPTASPYPSATAPTPVPAPPPAPASPAMTARWQTTVYGTMKTDASYDTTQSFTDLAGSGLIARPGGHPPPPPAAQTTYTGDHGRMQMGLRDSRVGIKVRAPEAFRVTPTALIEIDFFGTLPGTVTENNFFASPIPRLRHAYVELQTPVVDLLVGQTWDLFGWQGMGFFPSSVQAQGLLGQVYARSPQIRVSKSIGGSAAFAEIAVAAMRPPQRDSGIPEVQGGVRFVLPVWQGVGTAGMTGTAVQPLSIGVSADVRDYVLPEFNALPSQTAEKTTSAMALSAFLPVIPATEDKKGNSFSLTGELVRGYGVADLYTNFNGGGMQFPTVGNPTGSSPITYPQNVDNGLVVYDLLGNLHPVQWTSLIVGAQYYLPGLEGRLWIAGNYGHMESSNAHFYTRPDSGAAPDPQIPNYVSAALVRDSADFVDAAIIGEPVIGFRVGLEGAVTMDRYADGVRAVNQRVQLGTVWMF